MKRYIALQKVVEVGNFTKAAELLGYTQPALSQMISSLAAIVDSGVSDEVPKCGICIASGR